MKIQSVLNEIKNDITSSKVRIKNATLNGYSVADRTAKIYKQGSIKKYYGVTKSVAHRIISGTRAEELPYIGGAVGMLIPIPFASPICMGLGFLAKYISKSLAIFRNKH